MTEAQAEALAAKLFAAWPSPLYGELTVRVYVDEIERFDYERALDALDRLIRTLHQRPSIAEWREMYLSPTLRDKWALKALPLPAVTPEERAANVARYGRMFTSVGWGPSRESAEEIAARAEGESWTA